MDDVRRRSSTTFNSCAGFCYFAEYIEEELLDDRIHVLERFAITVGPFEDVIDQRHLQPAGRNCSQSIFGVFQHHLTLFNYLVSLEELFFVLRTEFEYVSCGDRRSDAVDDFLGMSETLQHSRYSM